MFEVRPAHYLMDGDVEVCNEKECTQTHVFAVYERRPVGNPRDRITEAQWVADFGESHHAEMFAALQNKEKGVETEVKIQKVSVKCMDCAEVTVVDLPVKCPITVSIQVMVETVCKLCGAGPRMLFLTPGPK